MILDSKGEEKGFGEGGGEGKESSGVKGGLLEREKKIDGVL